MEKGAPKNLAYIDDQGIGMRNNSLMTSSGEAGKSAHEQFKKRSEKTKAARINSFGPRLGKVINAIAGDSKSTKAWKKGADGERAVGKRLDELAAVHGWKVLHDRRIPHSRANIDHILITDRGIFVIDAKNYEGLIRVEEKGGFLSESKATLLVGNRNQNRLIEGVKKQVELVANALSENHINVQTFGLLAFYGAEWPLFFKTKEIQGVLINSKGIESAVLSQSMTSRIDFEEVFQMLKKALPSK